MWRRALMPKTRSLQPAMCAGARIRVDGLCALSRPLSNTAKPGGGSWLGSTKQVAGDRDVLGDSQHTTRFGMKTCSCTQCGTSTRRSHPPIWMMYQDRKTVIVWQT